MSVFQPTHSSQNTISLQDIVHHTLVKKYPGYSYSSQQRHVKTHRQMSHPVRLHAAAAAAAAAASIASQSGSHKRHDMKQQQRPSQTQSQQSLPSQSQPPPFSSSFGSSDWSQTSTPAPMQSQQLATVSFMSQINSLKASIDKISGQQDELLKIAQKNQQQVRYLSTEVKEVQKNIERMQVSFSKRVRELEQQQAATARSLQTHRQFGSPEKMASVRQSCHRRSASPAGDKSSHYPPRKRKVVQASPAETEVVDQGPHTRLAWSSTGSHGQSPCPPAAMSAKKPKKAIKKDSSQIARVVNLGGSKQSSNELAHDFHNADVDTFEQQQHDAAGAAFLFGNETDFVALSAQDEGPMHDAANSGITPASEDCVFEMLRSATYFGSEDQDECLSPSQ